MMRKVLSPDITPPLSDEEDEGTPFIEVYAPLQSECVKDTFENRDYVNKPQMN